MPSRSERHGEDAVSEVIGFLITFSIIATILVAAMLAFNQAQERAEARVVAIQVDSIAQRVAGVIVEAGLFAESQDGASTTFAILIELPNDLQGDGYQIAIDDAAGTVTVDSAKGSATQSVFGIGGGTIALCSSASQYFSVNGGNVYVVYDASAADPDDQCLGLSNSPVS